MLSFHATKVFNTFEGGAIICHDARPKQRIASLKNFGFAGETRVVAPGINAKMNEMEAAFGLLQLQYIDNALLARADISQRYSEAFKLPCANEIADKVLCLPIYPGLAADDQQRITDLIRSIAAPALPATPAIWLEGA